MSSFVSCSILFHDHDSMGCNLWSFFHFCIIHRQKLYFLNPTSKAVNELIKVNIFNRGNRKGFFDSLIIAQSKLLDGSMYHNPFAFLQFRIYFKFPRILFQTAINHYIQTFNMTCYLETVWHCFKFIEKCLFTSIFDKVDSWNLLVTSMIEFSNIHGNLCWKTALNTQTKESYIPSKTSP